MPGAAHVGDVEVAGAAVRELRDLRAVRVHLLQVEQALLARDRPVGRLARALQDRLRVEGQRHRVGLVAEQAVGVVVAPQLHAVDLEHVVAHAGVHADLGERRAVEAPPRSGPARIRAMRKRRGRRVELEAGAGQRHLRPGRDLVVAALDVGVADVELGHHLAQHVVEVGAVGDVGQERPVALADRLPVVAVHVLDVEEVAVAAPGLVEELRATPRPGTRSTIEALRGDGLLLLGLGLDVVEVVLSPCRTRTFAPSRESAQPVASSASVVSLRSLKE